MGMYRMLKYYTIIAFNELAIRHYLPKKSDNLPGSMAELIKSLWLPDLKSITVLLYDFSTMNENFILSLL